MTDLTEAIWFKDVEVGDIITVTTGKREEHEAWDYHFGVLQMSAYWPQGAFQAINPMGVASPILPGELHGSGQWTTREQNPCQTQVSAVTACFEGICLGSFLIAKLAFQPERIIMDKSGQEITALSIAKAILPASKRRRK